MELNPWPTSALSVGFVCFHKSKLHLLFTNTGEMNFLSQNLGMVLSLVCKFAPSS